MADANKHSEQHIIDCEGKNSSATYDGRHYRVSADQIRAMIERALPPDLTAE